MDHSANDYYPFGMVQPGRSYNEIGVNYRYGFNGKEKDDEVKGPGNQIDYGMRVYDPRIGKFLSVDPLTISYPMLTPYQFASNSPISNIDLDGLEAWKVIRQWDQTDVANYATYANTKIKEYEANKVKDDCANFALRLIVGYASENGLPLSLRNSSVIFDASQPRFKSVNQYLNEVRDKIQAIDLILNTYGIPQSQTQSGDLEIVHYTINEKKKVDFQHILIFKEYNKMNPLSSTIVYGNLLSNHTGAELKELNFNWARSKKYNDGVQNKLSIYSGPLNSRWNVLNPVNFPNSTPSRDTPGKTSGDTTPSKQPEDTTTKTPSNGHVFLPHNTYSTGGSDNNKRDTSL